MREQYLKTYGHQFGFDSQHATDSCIFTVKGVIKYYTKQNSSVFISFLDAAKAFDRVSHKTLFSIMINRNIPMGIAGVIAFWYQSQPMCVKCGKLFMIILIFQIVCAKVRYCPQNYLLCILMICPMN